MAKTKSFIGRSFLNKDLSLTGSVKWSFEEDNSDGYDCDVEIRGCGNTRVELDFNLYGYDKTQAQIRKQVNAHKYKMNRIRIALDQIETAMDEFMEKGEAE